jgi:hypothetical protein
MNMDQKIFLQIFIIALVLCLCVLPVSAVIQEVTLKGTVSALNPEKNTLTLENPAQYGCDYLTGGTPVCTFTPIDSVPVTGTVPASTAYSVFKAGDTVVATSLGGTGGTWITLAKLYGPGRNEEYVTDIVGDPGTVPTPLIGDYALDITMAPECTTCSGTTCTAASAYVKVKSSGTVVLTKTLGPRQSLMYNGRNDGSSIAVTLVKGEALSTACAGGRSGMTGPQPVSVFIVNVVPPIGLTPPVDGGATTTRPGEALADPRNSPVGTPIPVMTPNLAKDTEPTPTAKAALLPFAAIGALGLMALVFTARRF